MLQKSAVNFVWSLQANSLPFPINSSIRSLFSEYAQTPSHSLNKFHLPKTPSFINSLTNFSTISSRTLKETTCFLEPTTQSETILMSKSRFWTQWWQQKWSLGFNYFFRWSSNTPFRMRLSQNWIYNCSSIYCKLNQQES